MLNRSRRRPAFTMIEVMVTLGIAALISGLVYQIMHSSTKINRKVEDKSEAIQSANLALESIKRDLKQLVTAPFLTNGTSFIGQTGDSQHPVLISDDGTQISFYIPDPTGAIDAATGKYTLATVYYRILKAQVEDGGLKADVYHLLRFVSAKNDLAQEAGANAIPGAGNIGGIYLMPAKDDAGNIAPPIHFRLLGPNPNEGAGSPQADSGDKNYYVEIKLTGSDGMAQEGQPRSDLNVLEDPSRLAQVPALRTNDFVMFDQPAQPLYINQPGNPPQTTGLPLTLKDNPKGPAQGTPPGPGNPATPGDPTNPNNPPGPANPGPGPVAANPPAGTPPAGNPPAGDPNAPPSTPPAPPAKPPVADPTGTKSWATYETKDASGKVTGTVEAVLHNDGSLTLTQKDAGGAVIDKTTQPATVQSNGANASKAALDAFLAKSGIDPNSVRNDPTINPPPDYGQ